MPTNCAELRVLANIWSLANAFSSLVGDAFYLCEAKKFNSRLQENLKVNPVECINGQFILRLVSNADYALE